MQHGSNSTTLEKSSGSVGDGLTQIGEFTICTHGRAANSGNGRRYRVHRDEVEASKAVLSECRRTRWARKGVSPSAEQLSDMIVGRDDGADFSISTGAVIIAASELGIVWAPLGVRDALIGVNIDDVRRRTNTPAPVPAQAQEDEYRVRPDIKFLNASTQPPPQEWAVQDCILKRQVTTLYGDGGVGKSLLALQLAASTVLGRGWFGCKPEPGPVIYFGAEDDEDELHRRLHCIASQLGEVQVAASPQRRRDCRLGTGHAAASRRPDLSGGANCGASAARTLYVSAGGQASCSLSTPFYRKVIS
jgi:AAA domain